MPKPITPFVGCDVFVINDENKVLLIQRADNGFWAMPGGCQDLGETPAQCAVRECKEETGFKIKLLGLLGVWSSKNYEYLNYPWKENEFSHLVFSAKIIGGVAQTSSETLKVEWFSANSLPPLSDGHASRIEFAFKALNKNLAPFFE